MLPLEEFHLYNSGERGMFLALGPMHIFSPFLDTYISSFFKTHTQSYTTLII